MSKYAKYRIRQDPKQGMNPVWRGIGCILLVVVPLLAFGLMELLVPVLIKTGKVPYQLVGYVHFPDWIRSLPGLGLQRDDHIQHRPVYRKSK